MKIIANHEMELKLKKIIPEDKQDNLVIIQLELTDNSRKDLLSKALEYSQDNKKLIIILGLCPEIDYRKEERDVWNQIVKKQNIKFIQINQSSKKFFSNLLKEC